MLSSSANVLKATSRRLGASHTSRTFATHAIPIEKDCTSITPPYSQLLQNLARVREILNDRPLSLAEKILYSHLYNPERDLSNGGKIRGETYLQLRPERVAMQDASAQYVASVNTVVSAHIN
jgi:homoaconitase